MQSQCKGMLLCIYSWSHSPEGNLAARNVFGLRSALFGSSDIAKQFQLGQKIVLSRRTLSFREAV